MYDVLGWYRERICFQFGHGHRDSREELNCLRDHLGLVDDETWQTGDALAWFRWHWCHEENHWHHGGEPELRCLRQQLFASVYESWFFMVCSALLDASDWYRFLRPSGSPSGLQEV